LAHANDAQAAVTAQDSDSPGAVALRRLRWRARRGMLENDLLLTRFFECLDDTLAPDQLDALSQLLDLPDGELLDIVLGRIALPAHLQCTLVQQTLARLQSC
jgi:antitoxin CptB